MQIRDGAGKKLKWTRMLKFLLKVGLDLQRLVDKAAKHQNTHTHTKKTHTHTRIREAHFTV